MTDKEIEDAGLALVNWFKSQDIMPGDAAIVMIRLMAIQLVLKSGKDVAALQRSVGIFRDALTLDIAVQLR